MKIEKVTYKKVGTQYKSIVIPKSKVVLEKIDDDYYIYREYRWDRAEKAWMPLASCAFFDGKQVHDTGTVRTRVNKDVDKYFELLVKYEKFRWMGESKDYTDAKPELEYITELNKG